MANANGPLKTSKLSPNSMMLRKTMYTKKIRHFIYIIEGEFENNNIRRRNHG
jgi:hypothetical protein